MSAAAGMRMSFMRFSLLPWEPQSISGTLSLRKNYLVLPQIRGADEHQCSRPAWSFGSLQSHSTLRKLLCYCQGQRDTSVSLFNGRAVYRCRSQKMRRPSRNAALRSFYLCSLPCSSSVHSHSGQTSVSWSSEEAAAADKQLSAGNLWQTSLRHSSYG